MPRLSDLTRPWVLWLVHHTHVDIGYTEPQPILFRKHGDFIATALDYCSLTDDRPEGERFCWTCEGVWSIHRFLERHPQRRDEFFRRVRDGRIEVTGLYVNLTDLFGADLLERTLEFGAELAREGGFDIVTAMQNDVNGWTWGLPAMLASRGIRYFDTGINETRARGVRPRPSLFHWAAPGGERVLTWMGGGYLQGTFLGQPDAPERLAGMLADLESGGYPHHALELRVHGEDHDNAPPGLWIPDLVRDWNARQDAVKLRLCTAREWFQHAEAEWPEPIPTRQAAWPDWWADGNGSALFEVTRVRKAQADLLTARALAANGAPLDREVETAAVEAAAFFCEHTWGSWNSTDDPHHPESQAQWAFKAEKAHHAATLAAHLVTQAARSQATAASTGQATAASIGQATAASIGQATAASIGQATATSIGQATATSAQPSAGAMRLAVFNPLPFLRDDTVETLVPDSAVTGQAPGMVLQPRRLDDGPPFHLVDEDTGEKIGVTREPAIVGSDRRPAQLIRFVARGVPASGWKRYRIAHEPFAPEAATRHDGAALANARFRLALDPVTGGIRSLVMRTPGGADRELVKPGDTTLGQFIYERIDSERGREALCEWTGFHINPPFARSTPAVRSLTSHARPDGAALVVTSGDSTLSLTMEITLFDTLDRVDFACTLEKLPLDRSDAVYHAFPFNLSQPEVLLELPGAVMRPHSDALPGSATDWHGVQGYFAVAGDEGTAVVATPDVPLVQVNGINTGQWHETLPPANGVVMSWVMNNYWFTNFPATQGGRIPYRYSLTAWDGPFDAERCARFAQSRSQPLVAVLVPA